MNFELQKIPIRLIPGGSGSKKKRTNEKQSITTTHHSIISLETPQHQTHNKHVMPSSNIFKQLLYYGGGSFVLALSFLSLDRLLPKGLFFFKHNNSNSNSNSNNNNSMNNHSHLLQLEKDVDQSYTYIKSLASSTETKSSPQAKRTFFNAIITFMTKYSKMLSSVSNKRNELASSQQQRQQQQQSSSADIACMDQELQLLNRYLEMTIELIYEQLKSTPELTKELFLGGTLYSLVRYVTFHLQQSNLFHQSSRSGEEQKHTQTQTQQAQTVKSDDAMSSACELINELIFQMNTQTVQIPKLQNSVYSVLNIVPMMMLVGRSNAMFRQTCSNILAFLSLNNRFIPNDMWDKLALKCMESDSMETLADTMLRMATKTDATSQVCMRSSIITCAFLADGRPELIRRLKAHVGRYTPDEQRTLFKSWSKHSVENADIFKPFALKLIQFFSPQ